MYITRRTVIQLSIFLVVSLVGLTIMAFGYIQVPSLFFGIGRYTVTLELPEASGLYKRGNVTYRGTEVGLIENVTLTDTGVQAELSLDSDVKIPSDLVAEVHSVSAVGEQYVQLLPKNDTSAPLKQGDTIRSGDTSAPPDINALLDATNRGLQAIPRDNLKTTIDEAYTAFAGLGPDIGRFIQGGANLATDSKKNLNELTNVVDNVGPILDTQTDTADSVQAWAAHLAAVTTSLKNNDGAVSGVLQNAPAAADEVRALFDRLQPSLPILLSNLVSLADVGVAYRANLEQLLVLLPQGVQIIQGTGVPNRDTKPDYKGAFLSFNLNINLPKPCTTGFLPPSQMRSAAKTDYPDFPKGLLYCRTPQDGPNNVRGAKNYPCETRPGKRAASVKLCESDQPYVPLNDGFSFKGDPNATLTGQSVPQFEPGEPIPPGYAADAPPPAAPVPDGAPPQPEALPPPPIAVAQYDPATGTYVGPDGKVYTQANLARNAPEEQTWQSMMLPPKTN
ncbi:MCE family protein [Mycolicibacterium hodleri]|uniref:MCE family protein n=1 Tax=Mycolicibacterium hodleri TaxID=49897 RepID=A0A502EFH6_9MYCO|nr:MlaD family protein [Mycolicibacterium hodleri]TPG36428.1 MCE family protein [Mycolicibacterium hodleri]